MLGTIPVVVGIDGSFKSRGDIVSLKGLAASSRQVEYKEWWSAVRAVDERWDRVLPRNWFLNFFLNPRGSGEHPILWLPWPS